MNLELSSLGHIVGTTVSYGFDIGVITLRGSQSKLDEFNGYAASVDVGFSVWEVVIIARLTCASVLRKELSLPHSRHAATDVI